MKNKLFLLFFLLSGIIFAQQDSLSVQTIVISNTKSKLFRGTDERTLNWYFYIDENGFSYLANLDIAEEEVYDWFERRKNSDNIFKTDREVVNREDVLLRKKNEPDVILHFQVFIDGNKLLIVNLEDENNYNFAKINIHK